MGDNEATFLMASSTDPGVLSTRSSGSSSLISKGYLKCTIVSLRVAIKTRKKGKYNMHRFYVSVESIYRLVDILYA